MRNRLLLALDAMLLGASVIGAFAIRFEGFDWWQLRGLDAMLFIAVIVPLKLLVFAGIGMYRRLWRYASIAELEVLAVASAAGVLLDVMTGVAMMPSIGIIESRIPVGVLAIDAVLTPLLIAVPRLIIRALKGRVRSKNNGTQRRALIVGAGSAGGMIAKELLENPQLGIAPVGFIDDNVRKQGHRLHNVPVLGGIAGLTAAVRLTDAEEVIVAIPSASGRIVREIMQRARDAGVRTRTVPGLYEIISGAKSVSALRKIEIQDLLRREPIHTNLDEVANLITQRTVLVTGAGGSIGSELCRQIAQLGPAQLIALGRGENSIFELAQELRQSFPTLIVDTIIADVRDARRIGRVMRRGRPHTVFHAAAHKHVPLMERNVEEAILNNVLGTRNVAELSSRFGVEHLVLISTDKAVRPTSIMGATKRIAEAIVHVVAKRDNRKYVSVRFGNVLGSRGSVVPTFMKQIASGGPITITHPEMRRYFMTIPEAVQLVLQAGALAGGGEVFVLDMGEPVRIVDLATDLVRLSGLEVDSDIEIRFTGMRAGEKLYEELFFSRDVAAPTVHPKILRAKDSEFAEECVLQVDNLLNAASDSAPEPALRKLIREIVPEYSPTPEVEDVVAHEELMDDDVAVTRGNAAGTSLRPPGDPDRRAAIGA